MNTPTQHTEQTPMADETKGLAVALGIGAVAIGGMYYAAKTVYKKQKKNKKGIKKHALPVLAALGVGITANVLGQPLITKADNS